MTADRGPFSTPGSDGIARPPRLPFAVRLINGAAAAAGKAGLALVRLDPKRILADASKQTGGLTDLGEHEFGPFVERLTLLVDSLEKDARLTWLGRTIARRELTRSTINRLRYVDDRKRFSEIARVEIRRPLVVVGLPRTGSTILHDILARDPASRAPLTWEVMFPSPPPERATYQSDARIAQAEATFPGVDKLIPGFKAMHPMGALLAQECVVLMADAMSTPLFHNTYDVRSYEDWLDDRADLAPAYRFHKAQLQHLSWRCPGARWVLKSGAHMWALDELFATYPDACVVQTHRDPIKVATSFASLTTLVRSMSSDCVDAAEIARDWTPRLAKVLHRTIDVREGGVAPDTQFYDMHFPHLLEDPMRVVESIYGHFGIELSGAAADRMRAFIDDNPQGKHGTHRYTPEQYGLDVATERGRFRRYTDTYGIEPEGAGSIAGAVRDL